MQITYGKTDANVLEGVSLTFSNTSELEDFLAELSRYDDDKEIKNAFQYMCSRSTKHSVPFVTDKDGKLALRAVSRKLIDVFLDYANVKKENLELQKKIAELQNRLARTGSIKHELSVMKEAYYRLLSRQ